MLFKKLRERSKSTSKSTKFSVTRVLSNSSNHNDAAQTKIPHVLVSPSSPAQIEQEDEVHLSNNEERDYQEFIAKARKEAEREEKLRLKMAKEGERRRSECNMSPWAGRM